MQYFFTFAMKYGLIAEEIVATVISTDMENAEKELDRILILPRTIISVEIKPLQTDLITIGK